jgi:hypothetical protein
VVALQTHYGCTENYIDEEHGIELYKTVLTSVQEWGTFEDIIDPGVVPDGTAGIFFSRASDIWGKTLLQDIKTEEGPDPVYRYERYGL